MEQEINDIIFNKNTIQNEILSQKIELKIQKLYNISIPSIILEFLSSEDKNFELEDLKQFFGHFGEVLNIILLEKKCIVLFKTFFIANICKEFLQTEECFKENMKNNFTVRWFDFENDHHLLLQEIKPLFEEIYKKNIINIKNIEEKKLGNNQNYNSNANNNIGIRMNMNMNINNFNINTTMNPMAQNQNMVGLQNIQYLQLLQMAQMKMNKSLQNNNNIPQGIGMMPGYNFNPMNQMQLQHQNLMNLNMLMNKQNLNNMNNLNNNMNNIGDRNNINNMNLVNNMNNNLKNNLMNPNIQQVNNPQFNQNMHNTFNQNMMNNNNNNTNNNDEKNFGKYTCKYEILIANDKDFQIARRLIGSKGCNMKNIINECKIGGGDGEGIKLRLRGKGSGYKEGPQNKESDEPLHLCISSKNPEEMKKACLLVDELLNRIHEDYKKYCEENNVMPSNTQIAMRIDNKSSNFKGK